jgi:DNA-binding CsgD family transcriptional regulator
VLSLAADGYRPCDIADRMSTNVYRVKDHIYQVIVKLGVSNLEDAVVLYYQRRPSRPNRAEVEAVR